MLIANEYLKIRAIQIRCVLA